VVRGEVVSGNYFETLGVGAAQGRVTTPDDDRTPNAHPLVVISDKLWKARFNADLHTLGRVIYLHGNPFTIVGILPAAFTGTVFANETDFWAPVTMEAQLGDVGPRPVLVRCVVSAAGSKETCFPGRQTGDFRMLGRLKSDVTPEVASAQLTAIAANVPQVGRDVQPPRLEVVAELQARHQDHLPQVRRIATLALCASGLVWLIACGNVANLLLARATVRRREIAIRLALGAGRWRVVRQLLMESTLLALTAGTVALLLTVWTTGVLAAAIPANVQLPITLDFAPDLRLLGWAIALSFATGLAFGCAPAFQAVRTSLVPSLKPAESGSSQGSRRLTLRNALVVAQLSTSVVVLVLGGLFVRSLDNARQAFSPGFDAERLLSLRLDPGVLAYKAPRTEPGWSRSLRRRVLRRQHPHVRDRHPRGAWRALDERARADHQAGNAADHSRPGRRARPLADGDARSPVDARQSAGGRPGHVGRRLGPPHRDRARGLLCARATRDPNRPHRDASRRVDR
jgi:predicted permease